MPYTKEQIKNMCNQYGIDITQCLYDIEQIQQHRFIKNKSLIAKIMSDAEKLIKDKGIINETGN